MQSTANVNKNKAIGRNDPCPCGSGKKYKKCCGLVASSTSSSQPLPAVDISTAVQLFESGRLHEAAEICVQVIQAHPDHAQALHLAGLIQYQQQAYDKAIDYIARSLALDPDNAWAHNNLSLAYQASGNLDDAYIHCTRAIELQPDLAGAYNNLGNLYKDANRLKDAEQAYRKAWSLEKQDPNIPCNLGWVLQLQNKWDQAIEQYQTALSIYPDFVAAINNLGAAYIKKEQHEDAINTYERALLLQPDDAEILNNLGTVYQAKGEPDTALQFFEKALTINPSYAGVYVNLAMLAEINQDLDTAKANYRKALEIDNTLALAHSNLAGLLSAENDFDMALDHYNQALTLDPHLVAAYTGFAKLTNRQEAWARAQRFASEALERDPENIGAKLIMCKVYRGQHKLDKALETAEAIIEIKPDVAAGYIELASLQSLQGQNDAAESTYKQAIANIPDSMEIYSAWSGFEESRHRLDEASDLANKALSLADEEAPAIHLGLAKIYRRRKHYDEAKNELAKIVINESRETAFLSGVYFEQAQVLDKKGQHSEAFELLVKANDIKAKAKNVSFNRDKISANHSVSKTFFDQAHLSQLPRARVSKETPQPIFIVGFPRSGTTLLEQILCSHPNISAGDELVFITDISRDMPAVLGAKESYPLCMQSLMEINGQVMMESFRDKYLQRVMALDIIKPGAQRFTDKMPFNVRQMPLIASLFPKSPILHIIRNPADVCVSNFFANFGHGNEHALNIEDCAWMFAQVSELADHYRRLNEVSPFMNYMEVRYEDLVTDQEAQSRKIIDFVGEQWDDRCLEFQKTKRLSRTASYAQVTEKMYTSSVSRYQRYAPHLETALEILKPTMLRLEYLHS